MSREHLREHGRQNLALMESSPCRPQMLLVDNMVHSDLHPGNILVRLDPPWGTRTLCNVITRQLGLQVPSWRAHHK